MRKGEVNTGAVNKWATNTTYKIDTAGDYRQDNGKKTND